MDFRSIAILALWTLVSGPIFGVATPSASSRKEIAAKTAKHVKPATRVSAGKAR